ncbi:MAG: D-alanyl-D-alanine carboxypeptidase/D-alanyl-D-alanine-endopeptidase [Pseudomonadota bacterium]
MTGSPTLSRRALLAALAASTTGAAFANAPLTSQVPRARPTGLLQRTLPNTADLVAKAKVKGATTIALVDLASGEVQDSFAPALKLPPASTTKALTALYALRTLGAGHRYQTRLLGTGPIEDGVLKGDLVLTGGGDPTLDTTGLAELATALSDAGVRAVAGAFYYDGSHLPALPSIDPGQPDHLGYNPAIDGLNLNFNRVYFEWKREGADYAVSLDARAGSLRPQVRVSSMSVQQRQTPIYTYERREGRDHWTVARGALGREGGRWLPVRDPDGYAADVFRTLASKNGINLQIAQSMPANLPGAWTIAYRNSDQLPTILRGMLKYSTNLAAECVGLSATQSLGSRPDSLGASGRTMASWFSAQMPQPANMVFADHSGLGDATRVSARDLATALALENAISDLGPLLKPVTLRDRQGNQLSSLPTAIFAKTGTLNFVSALGGYIVPPSGRQYAFAIMSADLDHRALLTRAQRERPEGGRAWARRARKLQNDLLLNWTRGLLA